MDEFWLLIGLLLFVCLSPLGRLGSMRDALDPRIVVGATLAVYLVIPAVTLMSFGLDHEFLGFADHERRRTLGRALVSAVAGMLAFRLGFRGVSGRFAHLIPIPPNRYRVIALYAVAGILALFGLAGITTLFVRIGPPAYIVSNQYQINLLLSGLGYPYWAAQCLILSFLVLYAYEGRLTLMSATIGLAGVAFFLILGRRSNLLIYLISLLVLYHYSVRRLSRTRLASVGSIMVLVFVGLYTARFAGVRSDGFGDLPSYYSTLVASGEAMTVTQTLLEMNVFEMYLRIVRDYPDRHEFEYGRSLADVVLAPVPRAVLEDKPVPYGARLAARYLGRDSGVPATILGRLYMDLGIIGVVVGMLMLGGLARVAHSAVLRNSQNRGFLLLYAAFLIFLIDVVRVGDYTRTLSSFARVLVPLLLATTAISGGLALRARFGVAAPRDPTADAATTEGKRAGSAQ